MRIAWIVALSVAGCTPPPPSSERCTPRNRAPPAREVLVWTGSGDAASTWRVRGGEIVDTLPGIRVATTRGVWRWTTRRVAVKTEPCGPPVAAPPGEGHVTHAAFTRDGDAQVLFAPGPEAKGANEIDDEVRLVATLGTLAFVEQRTRVYACGAHGAEEHAFLVWDVERGAPVDLVSRITDPAQAVARALPLLGDEGQSPEEPPRITEVLPELDGDHVRFLAQVTVPACFACSDGLWTSYSRSARVEIATPQGVDARVPAAVLELVRRHETREIRGWSVIPERMRPPVRTEP